MIEHGPYERISGAFVAAVPGAYRAVYVNPDGTTGVWSVVGWLTRVECCVRCNDLDCEFNSDPHYAEVVAASHTDGARLEPVDTDRRQFVGVFDSAADEATVADAVALHLAFWAQLDAERARKAQASAQGRPGAHPRRTGGTIEA